MLELVFDTKETQLGLRLPPVQSHPELVSRRAQDDDTNVLLDRHLAQNRDLIDAICVEIFKADDDGLDAEFPPGLVQGP